jgi:predicted NBD/HSP70 family sugar kinase
VILGIGVGASGLVDNKRGVNVLAPRLGWQDVPFKSLLENTTGLPVCVDNNVRSMALGEALFGSGRDVDVLAFVYGRIGVGAGFVVNGDLFRGSGAGAGEIGHMVILPRGGEICSCGNMGCLETLVSEHVLLEKAAAIVNQDPEGILAKALAQQKQNKPIENVFEAARNGDSKTLDMIKEHACYLGIALANLVNILNPKLILVGGMFSQGHDLILPTAEEKMRELAFAGLGEKVEIAPTKFGWQAGVIGAASLVLNTYFYKPYEGN